MKALKWTLLVLLALAAVLMLGGLLLPSTFSVTRSTVVNAPADKVYALVANPRMWKHWSVWTRRDPSMQIEYFGPDSGAGAGWAWHSRSEGDGRMRFTAAEPSQRVAFELFFPDFNSTSTGSFSFVPEARGTRVTWAMEGDFGRNPLMHWMALLADRMVGPDFDAGLANLKTRAEQSP